ncbi:trypsin-like peptidase domain-containing protein [Flavobacteriaceae bacterium F08102]|nr:trypsin-like peptidase domain-containing protein [Flavobacteriaceae bacterium F08102]
MIKNRTFNSPRRITVLIAAISLITLGTFYFFTGKESLKDTAAFCAPTEHTIANEEQRVQSIQDQILKIYPNLLETTVKVILGNSFASAVVVSEDGYILTAKHVIDAVGGKTATIQLHDGSTYTATCLGWDNIGDYGLMKIEPTKKLAYATMGNSGSLAKDEACLMFGNPGTSDKERAAIGRIGFYKGITDHGYLKTSCIMMPGDSGGPLFDLEGSLIGICSYINNDLTANYYPAIDQVKKNWDRLVAKERFNLERNTYKRTITEAPENDKPFVLKGGKETLAKVLSQKSGNTFKSVVHIESTLNNETKSTYGTLVSANGIVVAKSSLIGSEAIYCTTYKEQVKAEIVGRNEENDIVLLRIKSSKKSKPISLRTKNDTPGQLLGTVLPNDTSVELSGILGLEARPIPTKEYGFLGVWFNKQEDLVIERVSKGMPAENAGLQVGDKILAMNGIEFQHNESLTSELKKTRPQQNVNLTILRNGKPKQVSVTLGQRPKTQRRHPAYNTKTNKRKDGFPSVFTHDMPLEVHQCGTPVINLKGEVIGINIARRNRTCSLTIPTHKINEIVDTILAIQ